MIKIIKVTKIIIRILLILFITLELIFIALFLIKKNNNKVPSIFHYSIFVVVSESMEPLINVNDVIIVTNNLNDLKVNDIVTYRKNDIYITHMIVSINEDQIITKGINNNIEDECISKEEVLYKYIKTSKLLTFVYKLINNIVFKIVFVILLLSFLINNFFEVIKLKQRSKYE